AREDHAVASVAHGGIAGGIGADEVARDHVGRRAGAGDHNPGATVARDDVAGTARRAADGVAGRRVRDLHAVDAVAHGGGTGGVGADEVAGDRIVRSARVGEVDAVIPVARDHVAAADGVAGGPAVDDHAAAAVAQGDIAGVVG